MASEPIERKLAAILSADVAGYSRLMANDETGTIVALQACRAQISEIVAAKRGRVVDAPGDNVLAEFPTALDAAEAAVAMQSSLAERNADLPPDRRMEFRIGIHLGDVATDGERLYGDGVNIAARIERLAEAGGVAVSAEVHGQIRGRLGVGFEDLGEREIKNIPQPVRVYRLVPAGQAEDRSPTTLTRSRRMAIASAALVALAELIWIATPRFRAGPDSRPAAVPEASIAVLPFVNLSADAANEYFSDGLSEELLNALAQVPGLKVAARTSSFAFKGRNVDLTEVGKQLGVGNVLEGSVRRQGQRIRIAAQLIDAGDGYHLWSETYDRELDDVFAIQADIARRVTQALRITLMESDEQRLTTPGTRSTEAYDAYLQGLQSARTFQVDSVVEAARHFRRAIALDPAFARAHAALASAYVLSRWTTSMHPSEMLRVAEPAAATALELDPQLSEAHAASGAVLEVRGEAEAAEAAYRRALELNPGNRDASASYGLFLAMRLRLPEAIAVYEKALETDPLDAFLRGMLGQAYQAAGRTGDALRTLAKARAQEEANPFGYYAAAFVYFDDLGDLMQGASWWRKSIEVDSEDPELPAWLAHALLTLGDVEQAASLAEQALAVDPSNGFLIATLALVNERRGDAEQAERLALRALEPGTVRRLGGTLIALRVLRNAWLRDGRLADLISAYEASYPSLTEPTPLLEAHILFPQLGPTELVAAAVDLAHLEAASSDDAAKAALLDRARAVFEFDPRVQTPVFFREATTPVEILILDDRPDNALDALEALVDGGWRAHWQWHLVWNPIFDAVRGEAQFERLLEVLQRDTRRHRQALAKAPGS
jgi:adenylate cyclase